MLLIWCNTNQSVRNKLALKYRNVPLQTWELSVRTLTTLIRYNPLITVDDVIRADNSIVEIENMGGKGIEELDKKVSQILLEDEIFLSEEAFTSHLSSKFLPESSHQLALGELHLDKKTHDYLVKWGMSTIGQLFNANSPSPEYSKELDAISLNMLNEVLVTLLNSVNEENEVDWFKYWKARHIATLPQGSKFNSSPEELIVELPRVVKEVLSHDSSIREWERAWTIIQRRFGLESTTKLTLDDLSNVFGLTRERVRQVEEKALKTLQRALINAEYHGKFYHVHPILLSLIQSIYSAIPTRVYQAISENTLLLQIHELLGVDFEKAKPSLFFLLSLANFTKIDFAGLSLTPIWGYFNLAQRDLLEEKIKRLDRFLTKDTALPQSDIDILTHINKGKGKLEKIALLELQQLVGLCSSIERRDDGLLWGKFEFLRERGNQVERLLTEQNRPMSIVEIVRQINHRLVPLGQRKVNRNSLTNQISNDERFVPIGKSGKWGLKTWSHINTENIVKLMEHYLLTRNSSATVDDIYSYVSAQRPVEKKSIVAYLSTEKSVFLRNTRTSWGLVTWSNDTEAKQWNREQVADFVAGFFRKNRVKELEFKIIKQALMDEADVNERQAIGLLIRNPVIATRKGDKWGERYAILQSDYKEKLSLHSGRFVSQKATLLQQVDETVHGILENIPNQTIPLSDLLTQLQKNFDCPKHTLYQYIGKLDYVERLYSPNSHVKICQMKGAKKPQLFPQIQTIANISVKENIERALPFLTEEYVDIGLFMLSKEFEVVLRTYLEDTHNRGMLSILPAKEPNPKKWRLNDMVDCVKRNNIVVDDAILSYLRQGRNDRAHSAVPSVEERQVLMKNVLHIGSLYIDYIRFFDNLHSKL